MNVNIRYGLLSTGLATWTRRANRMKSLPESAWSKLKMVGTQDIAEEVQAAKNTHAFLVPVTRFL